MAAALTVTPAGDLKTGDAITIAATGFAATHAITGTVTGPDASFVVSVSGTTDASGNITWAGLAAPSMPGVLSYVVADGTGAAGTVAGTRQVWTKA